MEIALRCELFLRVINKGLNVNTSEYHAGYPIRLKCLMQYNTQEEHAVITKKRSRQHLILTHLLLLYVEP